MGEVEDGMYDWHLLAQNGKTWEVCYFTALLRRSLSRFQTGTSLNQANQGGGGRPRGERHRSFQQQLSAVGLPSSSPVLPNDGSKQKAKVPNALIGGLGVGSVAPSSAVANVGIPAPTTIPRATAQTSQHPYANSSGAIQDYGNPTAERAMEEPFAPVHGARDGEVAVGQKDDVNGDARADQFNEEPPRRGFFTSLCRCG